MSGIIHATHPNIVFLSLVYGINERIGLEGLELMVSNRGTLPRQQLILSIKLERTH